MANTRLPKALCAAVTKVLTGSHSALELLFESAGAPGPPPDLAHHSKWKEWLFRAGKDPNVDSLEVLGGVLEEFMDLPPNELSEEYPKWQSDRDSVVSALEQHGFRYYQGGRVLPIGVSATQTETRSKGSQAAGAIYPASVDELLGVLVRGLPRAMYPLSHRRKGAQQLTFTSEYDIQDLLHALLRPWVADIRPEEFTPSYAGTSTRMDFFLPEHSLVIELKVARDRAHARKLGDELIIDIEHYRRHPKCEILWCVIYDPRNVILNPEGLRSDLDGNRTTPDGSLMVKTVVVSL